MCHAVLRIKGHQSPEKKKYNLPKLLTEDIDAVTSVFSSCHWEFQGETPTSLATCM